MIMFGLSVAATLVIAVLLRSIVGFRDQRSWSQYSKSAAHDGWFGLD
jgi:hypothetical protein